MLEFLDHTNFEVSQPILKVESNDAIIFLKERELRLVNELAEVREMLIKAQGFTPKITYQIFSTNEQGTT